MPRVLFLSSDLDYSGAAKQLSLLAPALARDGWAAELFSLGGGPLADRLRADGVPVLTSNLRPALRWLGLRGLVPRPGQGLVHVFGLPALRRLWVGTVGRPRPKIVVSLTGREQLTRFDRRVLRHVSRATVPHAAAADALVAQGLPAARVAIVSPAVGEPPPPPNRAEFGRSVGIPPDAPLVAGAARMDRRKALLDALCAFEFVRYTHPTVRFLLIGDGPGRAAMEEMARGVAPEGSRALFLGAGPDAPAILALADVVTVTHPAGGANVALEAMAAGRPVIVLDTPDLAPLVRDGQTGVLVPPGDRPALASALRDLLLDPDRGRRLGAAARDFARDRHDVQTVVRSMETVYRE